MKPAAPASDWSFQITAGIAAAHPSSKLMHLLFSFGLVGLFLVSIVDSSFIPLPVPAFLLIGFWFILQIFSGVASVGPNAVGAGGGVAYFAHIGGFIAGAILVNLFAWNRPRRRSGQ